MTARPTVAATAWPPINQPTADTTIAGSDIFCQRFLELAKRVDCGVTRRLPTPVSLPSCFLSIFPPVFGLEQARRTY